MGLEYQINVEGEWDSIVTAARLMDNAVWETIPEGPKKSEENQRDILTG